MSFFNFRFENGLGDSKSDIIIDTGAGLGSSNTAIRRFTNIIVNTGSSLTLIQSSTDGDSITVNENGLFYALYVDRDNTGPEPLGISKNSTQLSTSISAVNVQDILTFCQTIDSGQPEGCSCVFIGQKNDVLRAHTSGGTFNSSVGGIQNSFRVTLLLKL